MYRKQLRKMESKESKTGIRTIDKISEIPVVTDAITNVSDYYDKVKQKNILLKTSCSLAELSLKTLAYAATPIATMCKKPLESVDSYLCDKVDLLEYNYPVITKPTEQLTASALTQAKEIYEKTLKQPIDTLNNIRDTSVKTVTEIKDFGTNKVQSVVKIGTDSLDSLKSYGVDQIKNSAQYGVKLVDSCLEVKYAKFLTEPILDYTERSLDNWIPNKTNEKFEDKPRTLRRIYDINNRVARHIYQSTYEQLVKLNYQFENTLRSLGSLMQMTSTYYHNIKNHVADDVVNRKNTLKAICTNFISTKDLSVTKLDTLCRSYFKIIVADVNSMIHHYMEILKTFPIVCNGTRILHLTNDLMNRLNTESLPLMLKATLDHVKLVHQSLISFIQQFFEQSFDSKANIIVVKKRN